MTKHPEDFTYYGDCSECDEPMDESDAYQCDECGLWFCRTCWPHNGDGLCCWCTDRKDET